MSVSSSWFITENTQDLIRLYHNSQPWFNASLTKLYIIYSDVIFNGTNQFLSGLDYIIIFGKYNTSIVKTGNQQRIRVIKIDKCKTDTKFSSWPFWNSIPSIHWAHYLFQFLPNFPFPPRPHRLKPPLSLSILPPHFPPHTQHRCSFLLPPDDADDDVHDDDFHDDDIHDNDIHDDDVYDVIRNDLDDNDNGILTVVPSPHWRRTRLTWI